MHSLHSVSVGISFVSRFGVLGLVRETSGGSLPRHINPKRTLYYIEYIYSFVLESRIKEITQQSSIIYEPKHNLELVPEGVICCMVPSRGVLGQ